MAACRRNMARGFSDLRLFEVGQVYRGDRPEDERIHASGVRRGMSGPRHWQAERRPVDAFDAKADAMAVLSLAGAPIDRLQTSAEGPAWYHPGRVGSLMLGPKNRLATFGEIHPRVLAALDVTGPLVAFEIDLDAVPLAPGVEEVARQLGVRPAELAATGGEDYELLASGPASLPFTPVGRVIRGPAGITLSDARGQVELSGFEHRA
jgi:phenylalanyl-tRNA synthetase beta chain